MYNSSDVAQTIKKCAKQRNIPIGDLLEKCGLNKNTLSSMVSRGSWVQANSLAMIADALDVSVDYLLGRHVAVPASAGDAGRMMRMFSQLSPEKQEFLIKQAEIYLESEAPTNKVVGLV